MAVTGLKERGGGGGSNQVKGVGIIIPIWRKGLPVFWLNFPWRIC